MRDIVLREHEVQAEHRGVCGEVRQPDGGRRGAHHAGAHHDPQGEEDHPVGRQDPKGTVSKIGAQRLPARSAHDGVGDRPVQQEGGEAEEQGDADR
jgi:hypothetical protein